MLEMKHIYKYYNPGTVNEMCLFQDLNLTVEDGEFVAIVGSNGSGKTSLLNLICGSIPVDSGSITINGENITGQKEYRRMSKIGRVFQNPAMGTCPSMTILENLALADNKGKRYGLGLGVQKKREEHYKEMLRPLNLGLEDKLHVKVGSLSGGQRQAMSLFMSTMTPIDFLILDEHTAALDPKTAKKVLEISDKIIEANQLTAMLVTHNMKDAIAHGNRLIMMHEGRIIYDVSGEEKRQLHVSDLLKKFEEVSGGELDNDRMMLG